MCERLVKSIREHFIEHADKEDRWLVWLIVIALYLILDNIVIVQYNLWQKP